MWIQKPSSRLKKNGAQQRLEVEMNLQHVLKHIVARLARRKTKRKKKLTKKLGHSVSELVCLSKISNPMWEKLTSQTFSPLHYLHGAVRTVENTSWIMTTWGLSEVSLTSWWWCGLGVCSGARLSFELQPQPLSVTVKFHSRTSLCKLFTIWFYT